VLETHAQWFLRLILSIRLSPNSDNDDDDDGNELRLGLGMWFSQLKHLQRSQTTNSFGFKYSQFCLRHCYFLKVVASALAIAGGC
jgi:hypothetical protein